MVIEGRFSTEYCAMAMAGTVSPKGEKEQSVVSNCAMFTISMRRLPFPLQSSVGGSSEVLRELPRLIFISACASRAFHRPIVSKTLFPSAKLADSVATGYHTTYPIPRTAVDDLPI